MLNYFLFIVYIRLFRILDKFNNRCNLLFKKILIILWRNTSTLIILK